MTDTSFTKRALGWAAATAPSSQSRSPQAPPPQAPPPQLGRRRAVRERRQLGHQHRQRVLRWPAVLAEHLDRQRGTGSRTPRPGGADPRRREHPCVAGSGAWPTCGQYLTTAEPAPIAEPRLPLRGPRAGADAGPVRCRPRRPGRPACRRRGLPARLRRPVPAAARHPRWRRHRREGRAHTAEPTQLKGPFVRSERTKGPFSCLPDSEPTDQHQPTGRR